MYVEQRCFGNRIKEDIKVRKKILALLLSMIMVIGLIPNLLSAAQSNGATITVEADQATVAAGEIVNFTVYFQSDMPFNSIEFIVSGVTGMTYVENSAKIADGLQAKLDFETVEFSEINNTTIIGGSKAYTGTERMKIMEFQCQSSGDTGAYSIGVEDIFVADLTGEISSSLAKADVSVVIPVIGVSLDKNTLTVDQFDEVVTLVATVTPANASNKSLVWKSSDSAIVEVTNAGVVTGMKKGTATVTVETVDGKFKDTCVVTVNCTHNVGHDVPAEESTCLKQGHGAYSVCDDCGAIVAGSDALLPLGEHKGGTATCKELAVCDVCHQPYGSYAKHILKKHAKVEADHSKPGNIEYYTCNVCDKFFSDANGAVEIQQKDTVLDQISHSYASTWSTNTTHHWKECSCGDKAQYGTHVYDNTCDTTCNTCGATRTIQHNYSAVWSVDANGHWHECTVCHAKTDEGTHTGGRAKCNAKAICDICQKEYGSLGEHKYVEKVESQYLKSEATCTAKAVYYKSCEYCGGKGTETFETGSKDSSNHVGGTEVRNAKPMDCTTNGYTGDTYCKSCEAKLQTGTDIPARHILSKVSAKAATHEENGNIEYFECTKCDKCFEDNEATKEIALENTVILKGEHDYGTALKHDKDNHWKECSCGGKIEIKAHEFGEFKVTKEATATEKGSRVKTCLICNYEFVEEIPATGKIESPQTSDSANWMGWMLLAVASIGATSVIYVNRKKKSVNSDIQ